MKIKISTILIGFGLMILIVALILYANLVRKTGGGSFEHYLVSYLPIIATIISIVVAWEAEDWLWFVLGLFIFLFLVSGTSVGIMLGIILPISYLFLGFRSWLMFVKKILGNLCLTLRRLFYDRMPESQPGRPP